MTLNEVTEIIIADTIQWLLLRNTCVIYGLDERKRKSQVLMVLMICDCMRERGRGRMVDGNTVQLGELESGWQHTSSAMTT